MKKILIATSFLGSLLLNAAQAAEYKIDTDGAHASINFAVPHLGYSILTGRFNKFDGKFTWDSSKPEASKVKVTVDMTSVDSNHAKRDKHLRSDDFFHTDKFKQAKFVSTSFKHNTGDNYSMEGNLTFMGQTKPMLIDVVKIGEGKDPWGGYRVGFKGTTKLVMADFGIKMFEGTPSGIVDLTLHVEGIRK